MTPSTQKGAIQTEMKTNAFLWQFQLISEIRWRPFGEMRAENERWRERDGENRASPTESGGADVEREKETDKEEKTDREKIRGEKNRKGNIHTRHCASLASGLSLSIPLFGGYKWAD